MVTSMLRRNVVFVAGWVLAGLAIALLVNHFSPMAETARKTAEDVPSLSAEQRLGAPAISKLDTVLAPTAPAPASPVPVSSNLDLPSASSGSFAPAVRASAPAVVSVYTQTKVGTTVDRRGGSVDLIKPGLGSGVIMDVKGHVITNDHVIRFPDTAKIVDEIYVQLASGHIAPAVVVGTDSATDLAVLRIDLTELKMEKKDLPVMPVGRADRLAVGDIVLAIGSPLGLSQTVTQGIVSAKSRAQVGLTQFENFIQTDAAINHGNSGGALVNVRGELVGINTASIKYQGSEGLGMAIPVELVRGVMQEILTNGRVIRGWLGVKLLDVTKEFAAQNSLPNDGVLIYEMHPASPALLAGLATFDRIETLDGQPVRTGQAMLDKIYKMEPGRSIKLTGTRARNGQAFAVELKVIDTPRDQR